MVDRSWTDEKRRIMRWSRHPSCVQVPDMDDFMALVERAVDGPELPDYEGVPDSGTTASSDRACGPTGR